MALPWPYRDPCPCGNPDGFEDHRARHDPDAEAVADEAGHGGTSGAEGSARLGDQFAQPLYVGGEPVESSCDGLLALGG